VSRPEDFFSPVIAHVPLRYQPVEVIGESAVSSTLSASRSSVTRIHSDFTENGPGRHCASTPRRWRRPLTG